MRKQKKSAGFILIEIIIGLAVIGAALGMVGAARQKKETVRRKVQASIEQAGAKKDTEGVKPKIVNTRKQKKNEKLNNSGQEAPRLVDQISDADKGDKKKNKERRPQTGESAKDSGSFDVNQCFPGSLDPVCGAMFGEEPSSWYEQQQQLGTAAYYQQQQEAQQQLNEQYYYYQQQQQQQMFDPNQFMQDPYQQYNPVLQDFYQQMFPGLYQ